jgi:thiamine biosynthesis lipoprotein
LKKPGMQIDLGGIAKGYAADEAHAVLKKHGITRALVAAGGDVTVSDPPPGKEGWEIGIAPIEPKPDAPVPTFLLANGSVSTSGDLNQFTVIDDTRYSHIVDPKTGIGLVGRMSVTVVAPDGITADSLATAISILGPEAGNKLIANRKGVSFRFARMQGEEVEVIYGGRGPLNREP